MLEQNTVDLLDEMGVGERMHHEGLVHEGIELRFGGQAHRIDMTALTGGRAITVYGQQDVVKDLIAARLGAGGQVLFEVEDVRVEGIDSGRPIVAYRHEGVAHRLQCDVVAGCDGFHGVCRDLVPDGVVHERVYPFAWLGVLAEVAPSSEELIYTHHDRGFALHSMRSPEITRLYLQCAPDEDVADWPDERIWEELDTRMALEGGFVLREGPIVDRASRRCAVTCQSRCSAGGSSWPVTPCTSCRQPARRASTSRWPTCVCWPARWRAGTPRVTTPVWRPTPRPACGVSGAPSTSPGG